MPPDAALSLCRFVNATSALLLWGACGYLAVLVPPGLAAGLGRRLAPLRVTATVAAVVSAVALVPVQTAVIGDGWADALSAETLSAVLFETSVGHALLVRLGCAGLLALALMVPLHRRDGAAAAAAGLLLASMALTGHAVLPTGGLSRVHQLNHGLHLLAGGGWFGALVPVLLILRSPGEAARRGEAAQALIAFCRWGQWAVALTVLSGVINCLLILNPWPSDFTMTYVRLLTVKTVLVGAMVAAALINRLSVLPRLARQPGPALRALAFGVGVEIILGVAVIALVAIFGILPPTLD